MKLKELAHIANTPIEVKSAGNGRVLCKRFNKKKHVEIGEMEVGSMWCEIRANRMSGYSSYAQPVICVYVVGH